MDADQKSILIIPLNTSLEAPNEVELRSATEKAKKRNFISRLLESLAESDKRRFGLGKPDCCKLNSKQGVYGG